MGVYPRACGGTILKLVVPLRNTGLSPRLRGNRRRRLCGGRRRRSIPAPAGEPPTEEAADCGHKVYPRACGGTAGGFKQLIRLIGLSPRLRGNRHLHHNRDSSRRSIPAPAGEPRPDRGAAVGDPVYPRACGGTAFHQHEWESGRGLSPRLRGNPLP